MLTFSDQITPAFEEKNIPIVFSLNDYFCPCLNVAILSIVENSRPDYNYDILVLYETLLDENIKLILEGTKNYPNLSVRFISVANLLIDYSFYTANRPTITKEAYFRLCIPSILSEYTKVIYLDADMVVLRDITELFYTDLGSEYLLASSRDVDGVGCYYNPRNDRKAYMDSLGLKNPNDYFISGMLVLNLPEMRKRFPQNKLLEIASSKEWRFHDQDVLNVVCEGAVKLLPMAWDVMRDCGNIKYLPDELKAEAYSALKNPYIIHYAGRFGKPWVTPNTYGYQYFWAIARKTPFYEELLSRMADYKIQQSKAISSPPIKNGPSNTTNITSFVPINEAIKVTVIMPVYNAEEYLNESIPSVLSQTLSELELLCIDDGSTDNSLNIIKQYAKQDSRIRVFTQASRGAGAARNVGLKYAQGKYLAFLDADDFFSNTTLEKAYKYAEQKESEIVIFRVQELNVQTNKISEAPWHLRKQYLPDKNPFNYKDMPKYIFNFAKGCVWNKLFSNSFIRKQEITFQEIQRANDILFTDSALVRAEKIAILDEILITQRVGMSSNLQANNSKSPYDFFNAFLALKEALVQYGIFNQVKQSFSNAAIRDFSYCLKKIEGTDAYSTLLTFLRGQDGIRKLEIPKMTKEDFYMSEDFDAYTELTLPLKKKTIFQRAFDCLRENGLKYTLHRIKEKFFN